MGLTKKVAMSAFAAAIAFAATSAEAKRERWKLHSAWGSSVPHLGTSALRYSKNIERMSGGDFKLKFFEPGALVPANEGFDAVSKGSLETAWTTAGYDVGKYPALAFFTAVPFGPSMGEYFAWKKYGGGDDLQREIYAKHDILHRNAERILAARPGTSGAVLDD